MILSHAFMNSIWTGGLDGIIMPLFLPNFWESIMEGLLILLFD